MHKCGKILTTMFPVSSVVWVGVIMANSNPLNYLFRIKFCWGQLFALRENFFLNIFAICRKFKLFSYLVFSQCIDIIYIQYVCVYVFMYSFRWPICSVLKKLLNLINFEQVLKGHIDLGNARFPNGTNGIASFFFFLPFVFNFFFSYLDEYLFLRVFEYSAQFEDKWKCLHLITFSGQALDILARVPLWKDGLDYRHGTGHGIGSYLNVHEGNWWMTIGPWTFSTQFNLSAWFLFVPLLCRTSYD